jgi:NAD(P)-dependent dehydrogenase (short-subunit alcohol dehydrogenase family)
MADQRVAIVMAAGRGIGAECARRLAADGYALVLMSPGGGAEALADEIGATGLRGSAAEAADIERLVETTLQAHGRVDAVVNNTGHPAKGPLLELTDDDWRHGLDLLLLNVIRMARLVTPVMVEQGGGAIVNISTATILEPDPSFPISVTMRAGLASFTKMYADSHAAQGVRMNNVLPGFIDTRGENAERAKEVPMGRYGTTAELASVVSFLVSDEASYVTGLNVRVDGGLARSV